MKRRINLSGFWLGTLLALGACGPTEPIRVGFIGGLSTRNSDVAETGRNGLILAVEQRNQSGGIGGRQIELLVQDEGPTATTMTAAMQALLDAKVAAVIGPYTSGVAAKVVPLANQGKVALISPTVTSTDFVGLDDQFIRINRSTRDNAREYAALLLKRNQRRVAMAYDLQNRSFTAAWVREFGQAYAEGGGSLAGAVPFESQSDESFGAVVGQMLALRPDGLLYIASAVDVARLAQQAHKRAPGLPQTASEWAASESLLELGGQALDGLLIAQSYDRSDKSPRYMRFRADYRTRFRSEPGYSSVATYDAATVLLTALDRRQRGEGVAAAVLKNSPYEGLQQTIKFDPFGDTTRRVFFTEVRNGSFVPAP